MFNNSNSTQKNQIPGYTGHVAQQRFDPQPPVQPSEQQIQYQIPGYLGFVPSIKSDNMYGKSYGRTTNLTINKKLEDYDKTKPWMTTSKFQNVDQSKIYQLSAAEVVGLNDRYHRAQVQNYNDQKEELPLPGYTGYAQRVVATNIFGQTYNASLKSAIQDKNELDQERKLNYNQQAIQIPDIQK